MEEVYSRSNFYGQISLAYLELGVFGTACTLVEEDRKDDLRFRSLTVGEYWLAQDNGGRVDTLCYRQRLSARQILKEWPDTAPQRMRDMAERENEELQDVICLIEPREDFQRLSLRGEERPWSAVFYLEKDGEEGLLEVSGYHEFPALCPRWDITGADVYGSSPGRIALANCRLLQKMAEDGVRALNREVRPPLLAPGSLLDQYGGLDLSEDALNYYNGAMGNANPVLPAIQVKANLQGLTAWTEIYRQQIRNDFYTNMFLMLERDDAGKMTATEVNARNAEKMIILGPVLDRLRGELFQPLVERSFNLLLRSGVLPPPPEEIQGADLKIEFVSVLAQAQQQAKIAPAQRLVASAMEAAQFVPAVLDNLNFDAYIRDLADKLGVNPEIMTDTEAMEQLRQQRAEAQQALQQREQMAESVALTQGMAGAAKDLSGGMQGERATG
jgi:hypothetical protein